MELEQLQMVMFRIDVDNNRVDLHTEVTMLSPQDPISIADLQ